MEAAYPWSRLPAVVLTVPAVTGSVKVVGGDAVFDFLYLAERRDNGLAVENVGNLLLGKRVALDGEGRADGFDLVGASQQQGVRLFHADGEALGQRGDVRDEPDGFG